MHLVYKELLVIGDGRGTLNRGDWSSLTSACSDLFLLLAIFAVEAVLADPPDNKDNGTDEQTVLDHLDDHDPDDYSAHVAHITICALSSLLAEALLAAAEAALVISGALSVDGCALEARLLLFMALHLMILSLHASAAAIGRVVDLVAGTTFRYAASACAARLVTDANATLGVSHALLVCHKAIAAELTLFIAGPSAAFPAGARVRAGRARRSTLLSPRDGKDRAYDQQTEHIVKLHFYY